MIDFKTKIFFWSGSLVTFFENMTLLNAGRSVAYLLKWRRAEAIDFHEYCIIWKVLKD